MIQEKKIVSFDMDFYCMFKIRNDWTGNDGKGIEINEDMAGNLPQLCALLTTYIIHFCQNMSKEEIRTDGQKLTPKKILTSLMLAMIHTIEEDLGEERLDEEI